MNIGAENYAKALAAMDLALMNEGFGGAERLQILLAMIRGGVSFGG